LIKVVIGNALALIISPLLVSGMLFMNLDWRFLYIYICIRSRAIIALSLRFNTSP